MVNEGWKKYKLGDIATFRKGSGISRDQSHSGILPAVRYGELYTTHSNYIKKYTSSISETVASKATVATYGDVLFAGTGETKEEIGKCAAIIDKCNVYIGSDVVVMTPRIPTHPVFLGSMLNAPYVQFQRAEKGQGDAIVHISASSLAETYVLLPSFTEQCAIADAFLCVDNLIANLEKLIEKKKAIKQCAMQELLTCKRRLPGFTGEWKLVNMAKNSKIKARIGWQGLTTAEYLNEGYSYLITGTDFHEGKILWSGCHYVTKDRYEQDANIQVKNGDVLITKDGTIGKIAMISGLNMPATLNSGVFVVRSTTDAFTEQYLYFVLMSEIFKKFIKELMAGSTIIHLYQKDIVKFNFYVPPTKEEQDAISETIIDMEHEITFLKLKLDKYRDIKQGMMQKLLTGEIRLV